MVRTLLLNLVQLFLKIPAVGFLFIVSWAQSSQAEFDIECYIKGDCSRMSHGSPSNPSPGNQIRLNPASVPLENGLGIEVVYFGTPEWSLVKGLGRAGASISPAHSEETFFGQPSVEYDADYLQRHIFSKKYESQKYTLATALNVAKTGSGSARFNLNLGVMAKYNRYTSRAMPGGGLSGSLGPILFGASLYWDETQLDPELEVRLRPSPIRYKVQSYNLGIYLIPWFSTIQTYK